MMNKFLCARCGKLSSGTPFKVPGPSLGAMVVDQVVCADCHDAHHEHLDNNFWKEVDCSCKENCPKCSDRLTGQNVRPVHRKAGADGIHDVVLVCDCCHAYYRAAVRSAMEKRKGETNG